MLKKIKRLSYILQELVFYKFLNFYLPNLKGIITNHLIYKSLPFCQQYTKITGLGTVEIGENCAFGYKLGGFHRGGYIEIQPRFPNAKIKIGDQVSTNNNIFICAANNIEIGKDTLIGQNVIIMDFEAHGLAPDQRRKIGKIGQVILGNNLWIGNNVTILKNSSVGDNSIIATGAVVSGHFPPNVIIGGVPARTIKQL